MVSNFVGNIKNQLSQRDAAQHAVFADIIPLFSMRSKALKKYETENYTLNKQNEQFKERVKELERMVASSSGGKVISPVNQKELDELKQKLEETKEQYLKSMGQLTSYSQKLVEINEQMRKKDEVIKKKEESEIKLMDSVLQLEATIKKKDEEISNKGLTAQILHDELQALQLELVRREETVRTLESENKRLLDGWLKKLNEEANRQSGVPQAMPNANAGSMPPTATTPLLSMPTLVAPDATTAQSGRQSLGPTLPTVVKRHFVAHELEINAICSSHFGSLFATGSTDKKVKIFDALTGPKATLRGCQQAVMSVEFSANDEFILAASNDNATRLWHVETGRPRHTLTGHIGRVSSAKFSPDGMKVISGSQDRTLKVWDLQRGFCVRTIFAYSSCNDLCITDDYGNNVISGHLDNHIRFWDARSGDCVNEITSAHTSQITSLSLSPDRTQILTNSRDNTLKIIDLRMFQVVNTFTAENYKSGMNWARSAFSPDGQYVSAGSNDGTIFIWNSTTTKLVKSLNENSGAIVGVCWSGNGQFFYSGDRDKNVVVWGSS